MRKSMMVCICCMTVLALGCASISVNYDFDPQVDFSKIRTYNWIPAPEKARMDELTMKNITFQVNKQLQAKGFTMTTDNPDVLIAAHTAKEKKVDTQAWGYTYGSGGYYHGVWAGTRTPWGGPTWRTPGPYYENYRSGMETYEYEVGTLVLDFVNPKTKELVWRGSAVGIVDPAAASKDLTEAVTKLLDHFPPAQKK